MWGEYFLLDAVETVVARRGPTDAARPRKDPCGRRRPGDRRHRDMTDLFAQRSTVDRRAASRTTSSTATSRSSARAWAAPRRRGRYGDVRRARAGRRARRLPAARGRPTGRRPRSSSSRRYRNAEPWVDATTGRTFAPGVHYYVGGNTKVYGACLPRFREQDFGRLEHEEGVSPAWPFAYADIEPYYGEAERLYAVHGAPGGDPTEPWRSSDYPFPALPHEPDVGVRRPRCARQGLQPFSMPSGVDRRDGGRCIRCRTCDGFPCKVDAKADADVFGLRPALAGRQRPAAHPRRPPAARDVARRSPYRRGRVTRDGRPCELRADAIRRRRAARSTRPRCCCAPPRTATRRAWPTRRGSLGRNYMVHNSTFFMGVDPRRRNTVVFQKTLGLNDWYLRGPDTPVPARQRPDAGQAAGPDAQGAGRGCRCRVADYVTAPQHRRLPHHRGPAGPGATASRSGPTAGSGSPGSPTTSSRTASSCAR